MTSEVATRPDPREPALLKAIGFDKLSPEQRDLGLEIARKYDLDLLLKQLVLIDGRVYITRDGLLHIGHRSGQLDGIETTDPELDADGKFWRAKCSVYRKDMSRPFTYPGRYPADGRNRQYAPEMATKVAEVAALRRAFDVNVPTAEERWDTETDVPEPTPAPKTLAEAVEKVAETLPPEDATYYADKAKREAEAFDGPPGVTPDEFRAFVEENSLTDPYLQAMAKKVLPGTKGMISDAQRAILQDAIVTDLATRESTEPESETELRMAFGDK